MKKIFKVILIIFLIIIVAISGVALYGKTALPMLDLHPI